MTSTSRIYVASLTDYNAGRLHGVWVDVDQSTDTDEIYEQVNAMLAASPEAKAFPQGGPAEEWAIHDYEGFAGAKLSEWEPFERVCALAAVIEDHGEDVVTAFLSCHGENDYDDLGTTIEEGYRGKWDSAEDFCMEEAESMGRLPDDPPWPQNHIDWESAAYEYMMEFSTARHNGDLYVFEDNV